MSGAGAGESGCRSSTGPRTGHGSGTVARPAGQRRHGKLRGTETQAAISGGRRPGRRSPGDATRREAACHDSPRDAERAAIRFWHMRRRGQRSVFHAMEGGWGGGLGRCDREGGGDPRRPATILRETLKERRSVFHATEGGWGGGLGRCDREGGGDPFLVAVAADWAEGC
jgi:hypothetical protein